MRRCARLAVTAVAAVVVAGSAPAGDDLQRVVFREVDTLFANPGAGWMSQQRSPRGEPRFPCSVVYVRFNWADAEPAAGEYNWKLIDDVIAAWKPRGAAVALRVMTCSAHSAGYYTSPKWLFDAGCKGFEWFGDYAYLKSRGWSFEAAVNFMLSNHVTLINDNIGRVPLEAMPQLEKLARLAGYRFALRELAHPRSVRSGTDLGLKMKWANVGVGKLYRPFKLRVALLDAGGQAVVESDARADPRDWLPGDQDLSETIPIPATLKAGEYTLAVALVDPAGQRTALRLAMDAPEKAGRYLVSKVKVE